MKVLDEVDLKSKRGRSGIGSSTILIPIGGFGWCDGARWGVTNVDTKKEKRETKTLF